MGFPRNQVRDVIAVDLYADARFRSDSAALVWSAVEHRCKAEELARAGFVDHYLLIILIDGSDSHFSRYQNVASAAGISYFVDALAWGEVLNFYLAGENVCFVVVQQREQRN